EWGYPPIKKAFLFGRMSFRSTLPEEGEITYKDHVAAVVRMGSEVFVMDPPICFAEPLSLKDWMGALARPDDLNGLEISICSDLTLSHNSNWAESDPKQEVGLRQGKPHSVDFFTQEFLQKEWDLLVQLKLDPLHILGHG